MPKIELPGAPPLEVSLRRSSRARRYSLRVSRLSGVVTLTLPLGAPEAPAIAFLREREAWLRAQLGERPPTEQVGVGAVLPIEGKFIPVTLGPRSGFDANTGQLVVSHRVNNVAAAVAAVLKTLAHQRLSTASDAYANQIGCGFNRITLRDPRSRWGSCSSRGGLMYSWRLVMAPPEVLDYVAAHEVAHLREMNHGPDFWNLVAEICPDYQSRRNWLTEHGETLHRYRFTD